MSKIYYFLIYLGFFLGIIAEECTAKYGDPCNSTLSRPCGNYDNLKCKLSSSTNSSICVEKDHLGKHCHDNKDCRKIRHALCSHENECICQDGYINEPYDSTCVPKLDSKCEVGENCRPDNSVCINDVCQCDNGYIKTFHGNCMPILIGKFCRVNDDCALINSTQCSEDNECVCKSDYISFNGLTCRLRVGRTCNAHNECLKNGHCFKNECHCKEHYLPGSNDECVPTFTHIDCGDKNEDCTHKNYVSCLRDGTCFCPINHLVINRTYCAPLLNENCLNNGCAVNNSECVGGICNCKKDYSPQFNNHCLTNLLYEQCNTDHDCAEIRHAKCSKNKICVCKRNYASGSLKLCFPTPKGYCEQDEDCPIKNSGCKLNRCQCKPYYGQVFNKYCLPLITNNFCEGDDDCYHIPHAKCSSNKTCSCKLNYISINDTVICVPILGGDCLADKDCYVENSRCHNSKCECQLWHHSIGLDYCEPSILGKHCNNSNDCLTSMTKAVCSDKIKLCICEKNYLSEYGVCEPVKGASCSVDNECPYKYFECFNGTCQCEKNFIAASRFQCRPLLPTNLCSSNLDCGDPWRSTCSTKHFCKCKPNHMLVDNVTCSALLNGVCWTDSQCSLVKNSWCDDFHCKCKNKYQAISNNFCKLMN